MNKQLLHKYKNGNYTVFLYTDGTKEKITQEDFFNADFPDSIDLKITNYCDANCPMCHENSNTLGAHADLTHPFLNTLQKGTELAIGGGNPLSHPQLIPFLKKMKDVGVVCNITVNERHLIANNALIGRLIEEKLVWGVGVSVTNAEKETVEFLRENKNSVAHLICGIVTPTVINKLKDVKVLFLGYKLKGRGKAFFSETVNHNILGLKSSLRFLFNHFESMSFDNLALEQLQIEKIVPSEEFEARFMGHDGEASMYIDLVNQKYAISSLSEETYEMTDDIFTMFKYVKSVVCLTRSDKAT